MVNKSWGGATNHGYQLDVLAEPLAVCRLGADDAVPEWARGAFVSVTRRPGELSVVCAASCVPPGVRQEGPFRALVVRGPLAFSDIGVLSELSGVLARTGLSIFVISTFDTDAILVKQPDLEAAASALERAGHFVVAART